jgi:hypothetical protein
VTFVGGEVTCPKIGHDRCREALQLELPAQPVLMLGPESIGKWLMATWLASYHAPWFNQWVRAEPRISHIRELRKFLTTHPTPSSLGSGCKVIVVNLDGARTPAVQNALLKELEEPPDFARFLLVSSTSPLPTISSRCIIWRLGELTDAEVSRVLVMRGMSEKDAAVIAPAGRGRVKPALDVAERFRPARAAVLGVVRAINGRDRDLLERVVKGWGDTEDWMLRELFGAAASGRPTPLFSSTERQLIGRTVARKGIALLAASGQARPAASVRALAGVLMTEGRT